MDQRRKDITVTIREAPVAQGIQHFLEQGAAFVVTEWSINACLETGDLLRSEPEEEEVLFPCLLPYLNIRAIKRTNGDRAVHHELHAAGAAGLVTCSGYLLGEIGGGIDALAE